ncbi:MAG: type II toxin-antitoxin system Phd/YefM family antitoxin [Thermodesulfobacteriota bacterium]|nr:type II toxin-antitoxin system Phd/YefM family antitoxin [Thermodesulfobacteriota bacterium]
MQTLTIGELKSRFSEVLKQVRSGQEIIISYGKKREKVAVIVPYSVYASTPERTLGLLKDRAGCIIHDDFEISEKEMLTS